MAINFPDNPSDGDIATVGGVTYTYTASSNTWKPPVPGASTSTLTDLGISDGTAGQLLTTDGNNNFSFTSIASASSTEIFADMAALIAKTGMSAGDQGLVLENNKLFMYTGSAWYLIATMVNNSPTAITNVDSAYALAIDGTPTVITAVSTDPEGFPLTWSYAITSGSLGSTATISQTDNVFTITPSTNSADFGTFTLTISATDGGSSGIVNKVTSISLAFFVANSRYTTLLATATDTSDNNNIIDSSTNNHSVSNGDVCAGTFSPYRSGGYSTYFDGSSLISAATPAAIGTQDYTIEFWMNSPNVTSTWQSLVSRDYNNSDGFRLYKQESTSELAFYSGGASVRATTSGAGLTNNVWHHIAVVRNSGTLQIYVDGVSKASASNSDDISEAAAPINIGGNTGEVSNYPFTGYIRDMRVVNGTAVYTSNFTPPTERLTAITNTQLLTCHLPYIADGSTNAHAITVTGNVSTEPLTPFNNLEYSEALHGSSGYFNGSSSLTIPNDSTLLFGSGDYTVETWVYNTNTGNDLKWIAAIWHYTTPSAQAWALYHQNGQYSFIVDPADTVVTTGTSGLHTNEWTHLAVTKSGNVFRMFINGVQESTTTLSHTMQNGSGALDIGAAGSGPANTRFGGHISDVHVIKGHAKYTADFAPPTAPIVAHANTTFLMNPNPSIIDKAQKAQPFEFYGNASGSNTQQLFSSSTMKFDGNGDYILLREGFPIPSGGSFTIEAWARPSAWSSSMTALFAFNAKSSGTNVLLYTSQGINYGDSNYYSGSAPLTLNVWNHIAVTYDGTNLKSYVNGTLRTTNAYTPVVTLEDCTFVLGAEFDGGNAGAPGNYFNGYIQDVRVSTGLVRYTSNFTPPTALLEG